MQRPWITRIDKRSVLRIGIVFVTAAALAACAHQPAPYADDAPGFFVGLWHGFSIVFSLIGSIFMDIRIYEFPNSGGGYDFGFVLGALVFLGSVAGGAASSS
jgi:hypothetical protein